MDAQARSLPRSLVVVGGGAAGRAAAVEAARCGMTVLLVDEAAECESPPRDVAGRIRSCPGTSVLSLSPDRELLWASGGDSGTFRADAVVLATGGRPRPVPFPGWTLPGVVPAKGLDPSEVRPGTRVLVAGIRPAIAVARGLHEAGAQVVAALDAGPGTSGSDPLRADVPALHGHAIFAALGRDAVEAVEFGPVDPEDWRPLRDRSTTAAVDLIVVDFGAVARDELAVLAGCRMGFDRASGGWRPMRDPHLRTTVPGVFAAGLGAGWLVAEDEGRVAGITAAEDLGFLAPGRAERLREGPLRRLEALAAADARLGVDVAPRPGLLDLMDAETVLCRCEAVAVSSVLGAIGHGARDLPSIKMATRLGMGACQGRECGPPASAFACRETGRSPEEVGRINPRPPARPVTLGALARMARDTLPPGASGGFR